MDSIERKKITSAEHKAIASTLTVDEVANILYYTIPGSGDGSEGFARVVLSQREFSEVPRGRDQDWQYCQAIAEYYCDTIMNSTAHVPPRAKKKLDTIVRRLDNNNAAYILKANTSTPRQITRDLKYSPQAESWKQYWGALRGDAVARASLYAFLFDETDAEAPRIEHQDIIEAYSQRMKKVIKRKKGVEFSERSQKLLDTYHALAQSLAEKTARLHEESKTAQEKIQEQQSTITQLEERLKEVGEELAKQKEDLESFLLKAPDDRADDVSGNVLHPSDVFDIYKKTLEEHFTNPRAVHCFLRAMLNKGARNEHFIPYNSIRREASNLYNNRTEQFDAIGSQLRRKDIIKARGALEIHHQNIALTTPPVTEDKNLREYINALVQSHDNYGIVKTVTPAVPSRRGLPRDIFRR